MQFQNLIQQTNAAEELFAELCEGELELVCGGKELPSVPKNLPHSSCKINSGELAFAIIGAGIAGAPSGPGVLIAAYGGFIGDIGIQLSHC